MDGSQDSSIQAVMNAVLASSLKDQIDTTRDGFDRLERGMDRVAVAVTDTSSASQRDFRIMAGVLLVGLLATVGVNLSGKVGSIALDATPTANATTIEATNVNP